MGLRVVPRETAQEISLRRSQHEVFAVLTSFGPCTDTKLIAEYERCYELGYEFKDLGRLTRQSPSGIRSRRNELVVLGKVRDTGFKETLDSGRKSTVWKTVGWWLD